MSPAKPTILCIDDHWNGLLARKMLLEQSGYEVLEATGPEEGLKLFLSHSVDAVVLDYQMPGMTGDLVAAKMKRLDSSVPIMLLSAYGPLPTSKLRSVDTFLSKSQPPNALLSTLQNLLRNPSRSFFYRWLDHWKRRNRGSTKYGSTQDGSTQDGSTQNGATKSGSTQNAPTKYGVTQ
jgi:CheY-like chemotaxis protein